MKKLLISLFLSLWVGQALFAYTVTFKTDSATVFLTVEVDSLVSTPHPSPTAVGFTFNGWCKEKAGTNLWKFDTDKVRRDTTLYARWLKNIASYEALKDIQGGYTANPVYIDAAAVIRTLPRQVKANNAVMVPIGTWLDKDNYNAKMEGVYTFEGVAGTIPAGYANPDSLTIRPRVKVVVGKLPSIICNTASVVNCFVGETQYLSSMINTGTCGDTIVAVRVTRVNSSLKLYTIEGGTSTEIAFANNVAFIGGAEGKAIKEIGTLNFSYKVEAAGSASLKFELIKKSNSQIFGNAPLISITATASKVKPTASATATAIVKGSSLTSSIITGAATANGKAVEGTWMWEEPNRKIDSTKAYKAFFIPEKVLAYDSISKMINVVVTETFKVTAEEAANGRISISPAQPSGIYAKGTVLTLTATPVEGYKFKNWGKTASATSAIISYNVQKDSLFSANFEPITHTISLPAVANGKIVVLSGSDTIKNGAKMAQGKLLSVYAIPNNGYVFSTLKANGNNIYDNQVEASGSISLSASFVAKQADRKYIFLKDIYDGKVIVRKASNDSIINSGSAVAKGTTFKVTTIPNNGFAAGSITVTNATQAAGHYVVGETDSIYINVPFSKQVYNIVKQEDGAAISVTKGGAGVQTTSIGDAVTINVTVNNPADKKLREITVNGKSISNGETVVVEGPLYVSATVENKRKDLTIDLRKQTVKYDGVGKQFIVKSTPEYLSGFVVEYSYHGTPYDNPTAHNTYFVSITREADENYNAFAADAQLVIEREDLPNVPAPIALNGVLPQSSLGTYSYVNGEGADGGIVQVLFTANNENLNDYSYYIWNGKGDEPNKVLYTAGAGRAAAAPSTLSIISTTATIEVFNGSQLILPGETIYEGQTITLKATPNSGKAANTGVWSGGITTTGKSSVEYTLKAGANSITAEFGDKVDPLFTISGNAARRFDNTDFGNGSVPTVAQAGWVLSFRKEGVKQTPFNAGTYDILGSYPGDENQKAVADKVLGTMQITQAPVVISPSVMATTILAGQSLASSIITGTASSKGSFVWNDPGTPITASGTFGAKFVPRSSNYQTVAQSIYVTVNVDNLLTVTFDTPDHAVTDVKVDGKSVVSGTIIYPGQKVKFSGNADEGYRYHRSSTTPGFMFDRDYTVNIQPVRIQVKSNPILTIGTWRGPQPHLYGTAVDDTIRTDSDWAKGTTINILPRTDSVGYTLSKVKIVEAGVERELTSAGGNLYSFIMQVPTTINIEYTPAEYTMLLFQPFEGTAVAKVDGVTVPFLNNVSVKHGQEVTFDIIPHAGYKFYALRINGKDHPRPSFTITERAVVQITFTTSTDIEAPTKQLRIFSFNKNVKIESEESVARVEIVSMSGNLTLAEGNNEQQLTVEVPAPGIYVVNVYLMDGKKEVRKVVVK